METKASQQSLLSIFFVFLRLGCTSFGGPIAHLAYFRHEFVAKKAWIDEDTYSNLVALAQFLPGPASSQVGMGLGWYFHGYAGAMVSFIGFTLPSVVVLTLFAINLDNINAYVGSMWLHGLKVMAVIVVADAIVGMGQKFCHSRATVSITIIATSILVIFPTSIAQLLVIAVSALIGVFLFKSHQIEVVSNDTTSTRHHFVWLAFFGLFLVALPILTLMEKSSYIALFDVFYRVGSLVFGGGHVVLPLLQQEVVPSGIIEESVFLAGYGAAQAVPGPLFTFASFIGASADSDSPILSSAVATLAIFLPAWLLIMGALPFWERLRSNQHMARALIAVNASVVGILVVAFYQPIWQTSIELPIDFAIALMGFLGMRYWKLSPVVLVILLPTLYGILLPMIGFR